MKTNHKTELNLSQILVIFVLNLIVMLSAACGGSQEMPIVVPAGAKAGDLTMEPCTYERNDVEYAADCGTLIVPENRSEPNSRLIALSVIRVLATGSSPTEPIFWFQGGPGQSNLRFSHPEDLTALLENHDFVMVGYRGIDSSVVLDCPELSESLGNPIGTLMSDASLESYGAATARCVTRLQVEGIDLAGYSMTESIDDVEAARDALGYEHINLLGASYGTRLAMMYEWMYPDNLHRVVMTGVNPPGSFIWQAETIDAQIGDYAQLCAEDAHCRDRTDDLVKTMRQVSENMPKRWLFMPIDEDKVKLFTFLMFAESIKAPGDPIGMSGPNAVDMWLSAADGDASGMALVSLLSNGFLPNFYTWGYTFAMGSGTDEYVGPDHDRAELNPPDSIIGAPMSLLFWGMSSGWAANPIPEAYRQVQPSDVETLLESGSIDFMNPPQAATEELLPYLSNGEQVILKEFGHGNTFWNSQPEARIHMLTTFYDTGEVDASRYVYQPLDFDVGGGLPRLAKIVLAIVAVVLIVLVALAALVIRFVIRRVRRRKAI
ncbi:MAG: alpha/beta hydrolase [Chloroflexi bacterium]|nr:alpha/beta hydrolase [Chloroflexota bacterium]